MARRGLAEVTKHTPKDSVTILLGKLAAADAALARLANLQLPIKAAYHVAKLGRLAAQEIEIFYEQRNALIKELGEEREATPAEVATGRQGRVMAVLPANHETFTARLKELTDHEVTIPWGPIDPAILGERLITPADLIALGPLMKDPA